MVTGIPVEWVYQGLQLSEVYEKVNKKVFYVEGTVRSGLFGKE